MLFVFCIKIIYPTPNCIPFSTHVFSVEGGCCLRQGMQKGQTDRQTEGTVEKREEAGSTRGTAERAGAPIWCQPQKESIHARGGWGIPTERGPSALFEGETKTCHWGHCKHQQLLILSQKWGTDVHSELPTERRQSLKQARGFSVAACLL